MPDTTAIRLKIEELTEALKAEGLWKKEEPLWVTNYDAEAEACRVDFFDWLQFVYLPHLTLTEGHFSPYPRQNNLAPQAVKFVQANPEKLKLLQLFVELDALTT
jgi:uncharacterized protein YqcC (DUF446 family)